MGVITKLSKNKINELIKESKIEFYSLKQTQNGITDSTYLGSSKDGKQYIFKIFEESTKKDIENKIHILNNLKSLKVPQILSKKIVLYNNKPTILFSFIKGSIVKKITIHKLEEIVNFLSQLHKIKSIKTNNKNIYEKIYFENMLDKIKNLALKKELEEKYSLIKDLDLEANAIIHGDLFPDNAKFIDSKLSGVYDFAQSCYGNRYFDLSVLIISWSFQEYKFNHNFFIKILDTYNKKMKDNITRKEIKNYLLYACLYYVVQRLSRKNNTKDYKEYLIKFNTLYNLV